MHPPFGMLLEIFSETDDIGFGQLPSIAVKIVIRYNDFNGINLFREFVPILMLVVTIWFSKHTPEQFILAGMLAEINRIAVIVLKESLYVGFYGNCDFEFHRNLGFHA